MKIILIRTKKVHRNSSPNILYHRKTPTVHTPRAIQLTAREFLKEQLAAGEITLTEFMIVSQALTS